MPETEPRKPGERVHFSHPDFPLQRIEFMQADFYGKLSSLMEGATSLNANSEGKEVVAKILEVFASLDERLKYVESHVGSEKARINREAQRRVDEINKDNRSYKGGPQPHTRIT